MGKDFSSLYAGHISKYPLTKSSHMVNARISVKALLRGTENRMCEQSGAILTINALQWPAIWPKQV